MGYFSIGIGVLIGFLIVFSFTKDLGAGGLNGIITTESVGWLSLIERLIKFVTLIAVWPMLVIYAFVRFLKKNKEKGFS